MECVSDSVAHYNAKCIIFTSNAYSQLTSNQKLITSFGNQATADLFNGIKSRNSRKIPSEITQKALNKLDILNAVEKLEELNSPPGNRLEALKGNLKGFYSIWINN